MTLFSKFEKNLDFVLSEADENSNLDDSDNLDNIVNLLETIKDNLSQNNQIIKQKLLEVNN